MRDDEKILLAHGGGGELTSRLVEEVILAELGDTATGSLDDSVILDLGPAGLPGLPGLPGRIAFTTDSFVVKPLFFPGGDVGRLAVCGTANDLAMRGARPVALSLGLIIEEGLPVSTLRRAMASVAAAAREAGVRIATGDTKVVERGSADGLFINTAGIGVVPDGVELSLSGARPGDEIVVSGPLGNHAIAVLAQREGLHFQTTVRSDAAPLGALTGAMIAALGADLHVLNDLTRGGLAMSLNTIARASGVDIEVDEAAVPVDMDVAFAAEMLGLDVLGLANEGKFVSFVASGTGARAVDVLQRGGAAKAAVIGRVGQRVAENSGRGEPGGRLNEGQQGTRAARPRKAPRVALVTSGGGRRVLEMPYGEEAPRIC